MDKILFIMHMPPPVHGASMVGKYIHNSKLINDTFECKYINPTTAKNLEDVNKFRIRKFVDILELLNKIRNVVRSYKPDLVYFTANAMGISFIKDFLVVMLLKVLHCNIVLHFHNKGVSSKQNNLIYNILYKKFFENVKVILLAECLYDDVKKYVSRDNLLICPNGIPEPSSINGTHSKDNCYPVLNVLYLSNMMEEKGVWDLLYSIQLLKDKVIEQIQKEDIGIHVDFVGEWKDITESAFNAKCIQLGVENYVTAHGAKYDKDKEYFWSKADIFVFPTFYHKECFPLVLLEAMGHGVACVSTVEAGIPNIIIPYDGNNRTIATGFLVNKHDIDSISEILKRLMQDSLLCKRLGDNGRGVFETQFTLEQFEKNFVKVLKECMIR